MPGPGVIPGAGGGFRLDFAAPTVSSSGPAGAGTSFASGVFGSRVSDVSQNQRQGGGDLLLIGLLIVGGVIVASVAR